LTFFTFIGLPCQQSLVDNCAAPLALA
jgi:hypothetical protein